jgi:hypothetical protein
MHEQRGSEGRPSLKADVRWGLALGVTTALVLSAWAFLVTGLPDDRALAALEVSLAQVIGVYCLSGVIGGAMLGVCRPLLRNFGGRVVVGFLVFVPVAFLYELTTSSQPLRERLLESLQVSAFLGPVYGLLWHLYERYLHRNR